MINIDERMLENLFNGQFGKSSVLWHYLLPRVVAYNNSQLRCKYLLWVHPFIFLRFPNVFINFHEYVTGSLAYFTAE